MEDFEASFSVAPMLDWTDRHCRTFHRIITKKAVLYTEMVSTGAILYGDRNKHLVMGATDPVVLQLGGSIPDDLFEACQIAKNYGYKEINLNCGCPSDRVQNAAFGACLMLDPKKVARIVRKMQESNLKITVKHRIGVDDKDSFDDLRSFVEIMQDSGIKHLIIHARKAWLKGLSPKQNREIPPLQYDYVYRIKELFPDLKITINGGINIKTAKEHLRYVDGVMIGREAYKNPYILSEVDVLIYKTNDKIKTRQEILQEYREYIIKNLEDYTLHQLTKHTLGIFYGQKGANHYKRTLSEQGHKQESSIEIFDLARNFYID